jgi:hypothetical protein
MEALTAIIRTRYFPEKIKAQAGLLKSYVTNYAECSIFVLEHLGHHRYHQLHKYVSGETEPYEFIALLKCNEDRKYFCNESSIGIPLAEREQALLSPSNYALIRYNCFN